MATSLENSVEDTGDEFDVDSEAADLSKEFSAQLENLSLQMTSMNQSENLAKSRLQSLTSRQEHTLEKLEAIERAKFENEQFLKNQLRETSSHRKRTLNKLIELQGYETAERPKLMKALRKQQQQCWMAKEQLRIKIVQVMKLQARLANFEEKQPKKTQKKTKKCRVVVKKQKFLNAMKSLKTDYKRLIATIDLVSKRQERLLEVNFLLRTKLKNLQKEKEILKQENETVRLENRKILAEKKIRSCATLDELTDTELVIAQLEQENECLKKQLKDSKEREELWQMQMKTGEIVPQ